MPTTLRFSQMHGMRGAAPMFQSRHEDRDVRSSRAYSNRYWPKRRTRHVQNTCSESVGPSFVRAYATVRMMHLCFSGLQLLASLSLRREEQSPRRKLAASEGHGHPAPTRLTFAAAPTTVCEISQRTLDLCLGESSRTKRTNDSDTETGQIAKNNST